MEIRKETKWLCENAHRLERFSGKWVLFNTLQGVVKKDGSLLRLLKDVQNDATSERPFVFHVPSKRELAAPLIRPRQR